MCASSNRLHITSKLYSACLITTDCYDNAVDNSPKSDMDKGTSLMRGLRTTINTQPQQLTNLIDVLKKIDAFKLIAENMQDDLL